MKHLRIPKWLNRIGLVLLALIVILVGIGTWYVRRPWSDNKGTIQAPGLQASVKVMRDQWGLPQIYAENEHDLFFAQGYVHAQDRLWQMEFNRRLANGTLSEILGEATVDLDREARYFGFRRIAEQAWAALDSETRALLEAYATGVNAYINTHRNRLPLEFTIIRVDPAPWTPIDSLSWGYLVADFSQEFNHKYELFRAKAVAELGETATEQFLPPYSDINPPFILPPESGGYKWLQTSSLKRLDEMKNYLGDTTFFGSGAWVVDGKHTQSGKPMLANDPHLPTWMPAIWYENGLHGGRFNVTGFSFPGVPFVTIGHNNRIAWGFANMNPDVQDYYIEKLDNPKNPTQYEFMGKWYPLNTIQETLKIKNKPSQILNIHITRHGTIMNDLFNLPEAEPLALRWSAADCRFVLGGLMRLNLAGNWDQFRKALYAWDGISMTFMYADVDGNIGLQTTGKVPIRVPGHLGIVPVPGWTGQYEWQGYIPPEKMPFAYNPPTGYFFSANSRVVSDDYPYMISYDWFSAGYRAKRMQKLLQEKIDAGHLFTWQDMRDIQADTYSYPAEELRPFLLTLKPQDELQAKALSYVKAWDLHCDTNSVGAAVYETWAAFLSENTFNDTFKKHNLQDFIGPMWLKKTVAMIQLMKNPDNKWFEDPKLSKLEKRDELIRRSFSDALAWLGKNHGQNPAAWTWGRIHTVCLTHNPFSEAGPVLSRIFNSDSYGFGGSNFTLGLAYTSRNDQGFEVWAAPSLRTIIDLNNWDSMLAVNSTGQNGQLFHPHRKDQIRPWLQMEYHEVSFSQEAVDAKSKLILTLKP